MPIKAEPIAEIALCGIAELRDWVHATQTHLRRIPIAGVIENGARFLEDEYLGDSETMLRFNEHGIRAFCQRIGFRFDQLAMLESPLLASEVINDLVQQSAIKTKLEDDEFVLDQSSNTILGIVSRTYVSYTNQQFLEDITEFLSQVGKEDAYQFHAAYGINTELTVRYCSEKRHGIIKGPLGEGEDRSRIGIEFKNSMVGTSSVRLNYFLYRLICTNGMMVPAGTAINRVFHSGKHDSFKARLTTCFWEVYRKLDDLQGMLAALGALTFDPKMLASNDAACARIFEVIPASKQTILEKEGFSLRYPAECTESDKNALRRQHDAKVIDLIPKHFGGETSKRVFGSAMRGGKATVFDFVNVFTEFAKMCSPSQRLEIEERAGTLAKYIADNAKKF